MTSDTNSPDKNGMYVELFANSSEAICITSPQGRIIELNPAAEALFGKPRAELLESLFSDLYVAPEDERRFTKKLLAESGLTNWEVRLKGPGGEPVDCLVTASPWRNESGELIGIQGFIRDNSRAKKAQAALVKSENRFRRLSENAPDMIYYLDQDGRISYANRAWETMLGYRPQDVIGSHFSKFVKPAHLSGVEDYFDKVRQTGAILTDVSGLLIDYDGREKPASFGAAPDFDAQGNFLGLIGIVKDISQRVVAERELKTQKAYLEQLFEFIPEAIVISDMEDKVVRANQEFCTLFNYPQAQILDHNLHELITTPGKMEEARSISDRARSGEHVDLETMRTTRDKRPVHVAIKAAPIVTDEGQLGIYVIFRDITGRKMAEWALKDSERRHRVVLEAAPDPIVVYDVKGRVTYLNPAFTRIFGFSLKETKGRKLEFTPPEAASETSEMSGKVSRGESFSGIETKRLTKEGRSIDVSISGATFLDRRGRPQGNVVTLQDITRRKMTEEQLRYIAYHDTLTGLPNRKSFYERLDDLVIQGGRAKPGSHWALLFMDLDRFKDINDTLGHDVGDLLLKEVATRIKGILRRSDFVFRLGGDEFTVILAELTKDIDAARVGEKLLEAIARPYLLAGHDIYTSASIGISVFPEDGEVVETLVRNADTAMYVAKQERNTFRFFTSEMNAKAVQRLHIESDLRMALKRDQFELYYQPYVSLERKIIGVEALIRWNHPDLGTIMPSEFLPVAEETGLIIPIGRWVLEEACTQVQAWREQGFADLFLGVNVSCIQFRHREVENQIQAILAQTGLPASLLKLELTEKCVMDNPDETIGRMIRLHQTGIGFMIDDFGTGFSSLLHLNRTPADSLKIDSSFVQGTATVNNDAEVVKTIVAMAQHLQMEALAEGVETELQRDFLAEAGCRTMQGNFFCRPDHAETIELKLKEGL